MTTQHHEKRGLTISSLDFLLNHIGRQLARLKESGLLWKRGEFYEVEARFLRHITLGELVCTLHGVFHSLLRDGPSPDWLPYQHACLDEVISEAAARVKHHLDDWPSVAEDAIDAVELIRQIRLLNPPDDLDDLSNAKADLQNLDWDDLFDEMTEGLVLDSDYQLYDNFTQQPEAPSCPSFAEYRKAVVWFQLRFEETRQSRKLSEKNEQSIDDFVNES